MGNNATEHDIRRLPIYQLGFDAGKDVGLRLALDALTAERVRLARLAHQTGHAPHTLNAARIAYADGRLEAVAVILGGLFRTA